MIWDWFQICTPLDGLQDDDQNAVAHDPVTVLAVEQSFGEETAAGSARSSREELSPAPAHAAGEGGLLSLVRRLSFTSKSSRSSMPHQVRGQDRGCPEHLP